MSIDLRKVRYLERSEAFIIGVLALIISIVSVKFDTFELFAEFSESHESWELDEITVVAFWCGVAAIILSVRRARELAREIARREEAEARERKLARHDPLTGLANRRVLNEQLSHLLGELSKNGAECALLMIDLDNFKPVNDLYGHDAGDAVLAEVADRLRKTCVSARVLARLGGDEFVCVLDYPAGADVPARVGSQIVRAISAPYRIMGVTVEVQATVGIARCPNDATTAEELLRAADIAMYEGKRKGRGRYDFYDVEMDTRLRERAALETELRGAVRRGEIKAYFQPIISLEDKQIEGFEALARWEHPERGLLSPDTFIPIAEDIGVIHDLSFKILRDGCLAARDWPPGTVLSINISPVQLKEPWLAARLLAILTETGMLPSQLIIEVTENAIIDDVELAGEVFTSLHNAGVRIALDDFGKGYSSLSYLHQLSFDYLKIDGSFVRSLDSADNNKIVSAIAGLGKSLNMPVTAEGVETEACARALEEMGCDRAQGFYFGQPISADDTRLLFETDKPGAEVLQAQRSA
ncbi:MAG: EAL domain-containing protein [Novosphingobium sp.]|nr:EAL domain-containing protein [Novosphingobium sp.]